MKNKQSLISHKVGAILAKLEKLVKEYAEKSKTRLPAAKLIADEIGVSPVTLFKALDILRQQGVVTMTPKRGILIVPKAVNSTFDLAAAKREIASGTVQKHLPTLEQRIIQDIFTGGFSALDSLPQIKELMRRYGVRFETLKRALNSLIDEKVLTLHKRKFIITARTATRHRSRLVVYTKDTSRAIAEYTPRSAQFWRLLEGECVGRGITLDLRSFDEVRYRSQRGSNKTEVTSGHQTGVLGYILLTINTTFSELHDLLTHLSTTFLPVAILDEVGELTIPSIALNSLSMRLFVMSTTASSGRIVGNYLINHRHRRAAYLSVFSSAGWSVNRFRGLAEAFSDAGFPKAVSLFGRALTDEWTSMINPHSKSEPYARLAPLFTEIQRIMNPSGTMDPEALYREWFSSLWQMRIEAVLTPLFEQALADRSITAWVAENDDTAFAALKFLKTRKIRVPGEISLVGFDDTTKALTAGLTSFDFNVPALVHAVLNHVLFSSSSRKLVNRGPIEIPGIIMERKTSGACR